MEKIRIIEQIPKVNRVRATREIIDHKPEQKSLGI